MNTLIDIDLAAFKQDLTYKKEGKKHFVFDPIRKKYYVLQPEEFIRQLIIQYLLKNRAYPKSFISVERTILVNTRKKRFDLLVYDNTHTPWLMVECKAAGIDINQAVFDQIARYNITLNVPYLLVTNGLVTYCCKIDKEAGTYEFLTDLPEYPD